MDGTVVGQTDVARGSRNPTWPDVSARSASSSQMAPSKPEAHCASHQAQAPWQALRVTVRVLAKVVRRDRDTLAFQILLFKEGRLASARSTLATYAVCNQPE